MDANPNGDDALEEFKKATCLIQTYDSKGNVYIGTGFLYGKGGWVMSVAHNFQNDDTDPEQLHSLLSEARFIFTVRGHRGQWIDFPRRRRTAFIHHLQPGNSVDLNNMDIGMVKLGKQYKHGRKEFRDWEIAEEEQLKEMKLQSVFASSIDDRETDLNDTVYAIHYNENLTDVMKTKLKVRNVKANQDVPIIELHPQIPRRASGCPILNEDFKLVGLFFGGDEAVDGNSETVDNALMWNNGIERYIREGVLIIAGIGSYMVYKSLTCSSEKVNQEFQQNAAIERQVLEEKAKNGKLTIYLMDGEVINGPSSSIEAGSSIEASSILKYIVLFLPVIIVAAIVTLV